MAGRAPVLMVSVGLSPQVVTETLHALHAGGEPLPERLVLLTTPRGAEMVRAHLTDPRDGRLVGWGREWGQEEAARQLAEEAEIVVTASDSGDMETPRALASLVVEAGTRIAARTESGCAPVHLSIAGGRKSAAAILAVLMALLARPCDRLSHVQIAPEAAAGSEFFYPTRSPRRLYLPAGRTMDASQVRVRLIDLPLSGARDTDAAGRIIDDARRVLASPRFDIRPDRGQVAWDGLAHDWPPMPVAVAAMLAEDLLQGGDGVARCGTEAETLLKFHRCHPRAGRVGLAPGDLLEPEWLEEKVSRLNGLAESCGIAPNGGRLVRRAGARARARYALVLSPGEVRMS